VESARARGKPGIRENPTKRVGSGHFNIGTPCLEEDVGDGSEVARASSPCLGSWMQPKKHGLEARATSESALDALLKYRIST